MTNSLPSAAADIATGGPIFLFGVGRCGSTYQQARLSQIADVWIWGEHDGIVGGLLAWGDRVRGSKRLKKFSFDQPRIDPAFVHEADRRAARVLAWSNGFKLPDIADVERAAIVSLMTRGLPAGKARWGFKEVRYGPHDGVPERLLGLFPEAKLVHTLRDPILTVESSIFSWSFDRMKAAVDSRDELTLDEMYAKYSTYWATVTNYLLDLEMAHPERVITSRIESFDQSIDRLLDFLDIKQAFLTDVKSQGIINARFRGSGQNDLDRYARKVTERRERFAHLTAETATRAGYAVPA